MSLSSPTFKKPDLAYELAFFESVYRKNKRDARVIELLGHLYTKTGHVDEGLKMDRKLVRLRPDSALAHYNLACSLALKDRKKEAVETLRQACDLGYDDYNTLLNDKDLKNLFDYPAFQNFLSEIEIREENSPDTDL